MPVDPFSTDTKVGTPRKSWSALFLPPAHRWFAVANDSVVIKPLIAGRRKNGKAHSRSSEISAASPAERARQFTRSCARGFPANVRALRTWPRATVSFDAGGRPRIQGIPLQPRLVLVRGLLACCSSCRVERSCGNGSSRAHKNKRIPPELARRGSNGRAALRVLGPLGA
jgi:hypothetical protein